MLIRQMDCLMAQGAERIAGCSALKCWVSLSMLPMRVKNGSTERDGRIIINV